MLKSLMFFKLKTMPMCMCFCSYIYPLFKTGIVDIFYTVPHYVYFTHVLHVLLVFLIYTHTRNFFVQKASENCGKQIRTQVNQLFNNFQFMKFLYYIKFFNCIRKNNNNNKLTLILHHSQALLLLYFTHLVITLTKFCKICESSSI